MTCSPAIIFSHGRIKNTMVGTKFTTAISTIQTLPVANIKEIAIDKSAQKVYVPFGNQESYYVPTGMVGPIVKLELAIGGNIAEWKQVFSNDTLTVESFDNDMFSSTLSEESNWWVDSISYESAAGKMLRYTVTVNLHLQTDV